MRYLPQAIPMGSQDIAMLSRFRSHKSDSLQSVVRKILTAYVDGKEGFSGTGFILFGKAFPMPLKSQRQIYVVIIQCIYNMDPDSLDAFFESSEARFRRRHRLWIRPIAKTKEDLYLFKDRLKKPCQRIGSYFLATTPNIDNYERWLSQLLEANGLDASELTVFWN